MAEPHFTRLSTLGIQGVSFLAAVNRTAVNSYVFRFIPGVLILEFWRREVPAQGGAGWEGAISPVLWWRPSQQNLAGSQELG